MYFFNSITPFRRHHFLSITSASIISYLYYHIFVRNISTQALSPLKYSRIISIFDANSKYTPSLRNLLNNSNYLYISKLHINTSHQYCQNKSYSSSTQQTTYDTAFKHSILDMKRTEAGEEPEWVRESKNYNHEAFDNTGSVYIPDLGVVATNYKHKLSGFNVMSLKTHINSGKEMCFDLCVPTPPLNSKGSPHVLEHSVLAGTPKYPSKDAFSILIQGGFTSFLNAVTYKDRTSYLFSSTNEKGFYQVADVYMDSFFRPNVTKDKMIFDQECWHYRVTDGSADKSDADIVLHDRTIGFAGIVYSEMKQRSSDSAALFYYMTYENLFNNSYKYISGGAPKDIVDLTHQELVNFYNLYYGPRTSILYFYGPYELKNRLDFVDKYLKTYNIGISKDPKTGKLSHNANLESADSNIEFEEYKDKPKYASSQFSSANANEDEFMISWLLDPVHKGSKDRYKIDFVDNIGFQVLQYLLMGTPESVLYKALIDSNLGNKVIGSGFSGEYKQSLFSVGLKGVDKLKHGSKEEMVQKFEKVVFDTLKKIKEEGFKRDAIDAGLNMVEFEMRELNSGYYPKGLMLISLMQTQFQYGRDPFGLLKFDTLMSELRKRIFSDDPSKYFVNLLEKHMLNNTTRVTLHMEAVESKEYEKEFNKKIAEKLESRLSHLSKEEVDKMEEYYNNFKKDRLKAEGDDVLNSFETLELSDVCREQETIPTKSYKLSENTLTDCKSHDTNLDDKTILVHTHPLESHGILYMEYALALDGFTVDDLKYLGLFASMLRESGTDKLTPEEVSYLVDKNLGGVSFSTYFTTESNNQTYDDPTKGLGYLVVRSKSLKHKTDQMVDIVNDLLENANFSNSRKGLELAKRSLSIFQSNVANEGHEFASLRLSSRFSVSSYAEELVNGYSQLVFLRDELVPLAEKDWSKVESKLNEIRQKLMNVKNLTVNLTGDQELLDSFLKNATQYHSKLTSTFKSGQQKTQTKVWVEEVLKNKLLESTNKDELIVAPTNVNYVGMGGKLFDGNDQILGSDSLVFHYIRRTHLFKQVRMTLGAYGAFASISSTGHMILVSYADPNFEKTLDVYRNIPSSLKEAYETLNDRDLLRQKIGKLSQLDKPLHVENKSLLSLKRLLRKETDEFRQDFREDIFDATKECFKRIQEKFEKGKDWKTICSVVNNTTSKEAPGEFERLYIN
ncbi:falcilysin [Theileria orientalis strain Shintoku]|uniref:Falcilysin n=1 Tax=Theileria orientalis strain Shintoku TaxID=869250 RepID=J4C810_THEOR|nr:falcilysin [Theileria orientalis strain Shintoku]BAM39973.1 falcilysin [Theileria orientalis strain Shintoku]|eukprot:XP_009690274.1 falcilysin [Theileria orientalis strain Shintoku]